MMHPAWTVKALPTLMIALMIAAALAYLWARQWWRAVYWLSGALLNIAVTYGL